jgi:hypothetical protein
VPQFGSAIGNHERRTFAAHQAGSRAMDPIATALTAAWLDAVRRVQSERTQNVEQLMPKQGSSDQLTDVMEGGLKSGGAAPLNESDAQQQVETGPRPSLHLVDLLA